MCALFHNVPGTIENTVHVSSRLTFKLKTLGYEFPCYRVPGGETMDSFLQKRVTEGIQRCYGPKNSRALLKRAKSQAECELALIEELGFAGYFLMVWDVVEYCKRNDILIQGRGSAANSAVCYALEITAVDPIGWSCCSSAF
jgi:error-prone DNA polymerase